MSKSKDVDMFDIVYQTQMQVKETQEQFIFKTISNWLVNNHNIIVDKQELVEAVEILRTIKKMNISLYDLRSASNKLKMTYDKGYRDGYMLWENVYKRFS